MAFCLYNATRYYSQTENLSYINGTIIINYNKNSLIMKIY